MTAYPIEAKTVLRKQKRIDSWFCSRYSMNLYRGCPHGCVYCDGRCEQYHVPGQFSSDIQVKINSPEILLRELDPARKRKPFAGGYFSLGGGVCDSYNPLEQDYQLTRSALKLLKQFGHPVFLLTKSTTAERDLDLLEPLSRQGRLLLGVSFSTCDDDLAKSLEPGVPAPSERFEFIRMLTRKNIPVGVFLMPVIPFVTDQPQMLDRFFRRAAEAGVSFVEFGALTLKEGTQKEYFFRWLRRYDDGLIHQYDILYPPNPYGSIHSEYQLSLGGIIRAISRKYGIPLRIPPRYYNSVVSEKEKIIIMLEQMDYLLKLDGKSSPYGYGAYGLSQMKEEILAPFQSFRDVKGIGPQTAKVIREIQQHGTSRAYEILMSP